MCNGDTESKLVNYIVDLDTKIIIIKSVPANVCKKCGERFFDDDVMEKLERVINSVKQMSEEISVIKYDEIVA